MKLSAASIRGAAYRQVTLFNAEQLCDYRVSSHLSQIGRSQNCIRKVSGLYLWRCLRSHASVNHQTENAIVGVMRVIFVGPISRSIKAGEKISSFYVRTGRCFSFNLLGRLRLQIEKKLAKAHAPVLCAACCNKSSTHSIMRLGYKLNKVDKRLANDLNGTE